MGSSGGFGNFAFDGTNMWIANGNNNSVVEVLPDAGQVLITIGDAGTCGDEVPWITFDGTNMWVTCEQTGTVFKLLPNGEIGGSFAITDGGSGSFGMALDLANNLWVANVTEATLTKMLPNGGIAGIYRIDGGSPYEVAFDGTNMWVTNLLTSSVSELLPNGTVANTISIDGGYPLGIAFDGTSMWVTNYLGTNVMRLMLDGGIAGVYGPTVTLPDGGISPVCAWPFGIAFDGTNMWVTCVLTGNVIELLPDGGLARNIDIDGGEPSGIAFDGRHMWVVGQAGVTEL
jgi:DNA-binding beta-propeller fold protein YncE